MKHEKVPLLQLNKIRKNYPATSKIVMVSSQEEHEQQALNLTSYVTRMT